MSISAKELWAKTSLYIWPERYWLVSLPITQLSDTLLVLGQYSRGFAAIVVEKDEVSLTLSDELWQKVSNLLTNKQVAGPYQVITLNINLDLDICGYLLVAAKELADNNISIVPQCAYLKDHLVIKELDCPKAIKVLTSLIKKCQVSQ
ncbi:MAG: hypothetical protein FD167_2918 [bacterium]|nr:MAG: hypothetical protein FD167_2918 [bacterium]